MGQSRNDVYGRPSATGVVEGTSIPISRNRDRSIMTSPDIDQPARVPMLSGSCDRRRQTEGIIRTRDAVSSSLDGGREFGLQAELEKTMTVSLVAHVKA